MTVASDFLLFRLEAYLQVVGLTGWPAYEAAKRWLRQQEDISSAEYEQGLKVAAEILEL